MGPLLSPDVSEQAMWPFVWRITQLLSYRWSAQFGDGSFRPFIALRWVTSTSSEKRLDGAFKDINLG
jgi:hypothetical protein